MNALLQLMSRIAYPLLRITMGIVLVWIGGRPAVCCELDEAGADDEDCACVTARLAASTAISTAAFVIPILPKLQLWRAIKAGQLLWSSLSLSVAVSFSLSLASLAPAGGAYGFCRPCSAAALAAGRVSLAPSAAL